MALDNRWEGVRTVDVGEVEMEEMSGDVAMGVGFFDVAEGIYRRVYEGEDVGIRGRVGLKWVRALVNQGKYEEGKEILGMMEVKEWSGYWMMEGLVENGLGKMELARKAIDRVKVEELGDDERVWYYVLKGVMLIKEGKVEKGKVVMEEGKKVSGGGVIAGIIDSLVFKASIYSGKDIDGMERKLKKKLERKGGRDIELVKQYAVVLDMVGKKGVAIEVIEGALRSGSYRKREDVTGLFLLKGMLMGARSVEGVNALKKVLEVGGGVEWSNIALSQLVGSRVGEGEKMALYDFLMELEKGRKVDEGLMDSILLMRGKLLLEIGDMEGAEVEVKRLLDEYPGSVQVAKGLRLMGEIMWASKPARYRQAADYLARLTELVEGKEEKLRLKRLVGDCFYLNEDYENAAEVYESVIKDESVGKGPVVYQLVLSKIKCGDMEGARIVLDRYRGDKEVERINVWRGEWNYISQLKKIGEVEEAYARVKGLLNGVVGDNEVRLRLKWLKVELSLEMEKYLEGAALADKLLEELKGQELESLVGSHAMLLKGQGLIMGGKVEEGMKEFEKLREMFGSSKAAVLSYIIESRYYASMDNMAKAQQGLIDLSDRYPGSEYAAVALYEAALNAEGRETLSTYQEALGILERLVDGYGSSPLVYYARMKQGHILRKLGNFGDAEMVYENLVKQYPEHEMRSRAEMGRLDCLLAEAGSDMDKLKEVGRQYERVMEMGNVDMDVRAEAAYKSGFSRLKGKDWVEARSRYWEGITMLLGGGLNEMGEQGRYWLARSILEMGGLYEKDKKQEEANRAYQLVIKYGLPGVAIAKEKIK